MTSNPNNTDTGSRGAASTKRTIMSYFMAQSDHQNNTLSTAIFPVASSSSSLLQATGSSSLSAPINLVETSTDGYTTSNGISPQGLGKKDLKSSFASNHNKSSSAFPVPAVISPEIRKQIETLKIAKEQAESKVSSIFIKPFRSSFLIILCCNFLNLLNDYFLSCN